MPDSAEPAIQGTIHGAMMRMTGNMSCHASPNKRVTQESGMAQSTEMPSEDEEHEGGHPAAYSGARAYGGTSSKCLKEDVADTSDDQIPQQR